MAPTKTPPPKPDNKPESLKNPPIQFSIKPPNDGPMSPNKESRPKNSSGMATIASPPIEVHTPEAAAITSQPTSASAPIINKLEAMVIMTPQEARRLQAAESLKPAGERDLGPGSFVALAMSAAARNVKAGLVDAVPSIKTKTSVGACETGKPAVNVDGVGQAADNGIVKPAVGVGKEVERAADGGAKKGLVNGGMNAHTVSGGSGGGKRSVSGASVKSEKGPLQESAGNKRAVSGASAKSGDGKESETMEGSGEVVKKV